MKPQTHPHRILAAAIFFTVATALILAAPAGAIEFTFKFPTIPYPPKITSVSNSTPIVGAPSFKVSATFEAQPQNMAVCPKPNPVDCAINEWILQPDPEIDPNPPIIKKAWVYYFSNGNPDGHQAANKKVEMTFNAAKAQWEADVPIDPTLVKDDKIQYYIVVVDGRGNVTSEEADPKTRPCPSISSWVQDNATPKVFGTSGGGSCDYSTGYQQCAKNKDGKPSGCTDNYTLGSPANDTCGEPNGSGEQSVISGQDKVDIRGIMAGADADALCLNIGIGAPPPPTSDPAPIEGYIAFLINPDTADSNPNDTYLQNAYAITFAPEAAGSDPTLVKVLWDGECATRPGQSDILGCRLFAALSGNTDLEISYENGLKMKVKRSGAGTMLAKPFNLIGSNSKMVYIVTVTGEINLSGGNTFWFVNVAQSLGLVANRHEDKLIPPGDPDPCSKVVAVCASPEKPGNATNKCPRSDLKPANNTCKLTLFQADSTLVTKKYKIYRRADQNNPTEADFISPEIAETGAATYSKENTVTELKGNTYYYTCVGVDAAGTKSTEWSKATKGTCTEEDWIPPAPPDNLAASTPQGGQGSCSISWHFPVASDKTVYGFVIDRNDAPLNAAFPVLASGGTNDTFTYLDSGPLTVGTQYTYTVWTKDIGGNFNATKTTTQCTAEDLKPPARVEAPVVIVKDGDIANLTWNQSDGAASYDIYKCKQVDIQNSCLKSSNFEKTGTVQQPADPDEMPTFTTTALEETRFCFYIDAADNCNALGTCPSNPGQPNRSGFPPGGAQTLTYVNCLMIFIPPDYEIPLPPAGQKVAALPEGKKCKLEWSRTASSKSTQTGQAVPFVNPEKPTPNELLGYRVYRALNESISTSIPFIGMVGPNTLTFTDTRNLSNGTTYYYRVYAYDSNDNMASTNLPPPVTCKPMDTVPPATPTVVTPMTFSPDSCTVDWAKITDPDSIVYNVYRCTGAPETCNTNSKFTSPTGGSSLTATTFEDTTTDRDVAYTYCVTAKDPSGNENPKFTNACGTCAPSSKPPPPTGVAAATNTESTGATLYWTASTKDLGDYSGPQGYFIYRCTDRTEASCPAAPINTAPIQRVPTAGSQYPLDSEPTGQNCYAVTYANGDGRPAGESPKSFAPQCINIPPPPPSCEPDPCTSPACNFIISAPEGTLRLINPTLAPVDCETGKCFASSALTGIKLRMYDMKGPGDTDDKLIDNKKSICVANGGFTAKLNPADVTLTEGKKKIKIVLEAPNDMAEANHFPCDSQKTDPDKCLVTLVKGVEPRDAGGDYPIADITPLSNGGGKEVGNIYCDTIAAAADGTDPVDMQDFSRLKAHFGTKKSDCPCPSLCTAGQGKGRCYAPFADINGDGVINMVDYGILKTFFKKSIAAPRVMPKDADGNDLCTTE